MIRGLGDYDIRHQGLEDYKQTTWDICRLHVMLLAQHSDFVDQAGDSFEFVHDKIPLFLVLLHFLSTDW